MMNIRPAGSPNVLRNASLQDASPAGEAQPADLRDMLESLKRDEEKLTREMDELKSQCISIEAQRKKVTRTGRLVPLLAAGAAANFLGLMATGFVPLLVVGAALGASMIAVTIRQQKKELDMDGDLTRKAYEFQHKGEERVKIQEREREFEGKIARAEGEVKDLVNSAATDASDLVEVCDDFIMIDGVRLERKKKGGLLKSLLS